MVIDDFLSSCHSAQAESDFQLFDINLCIWWQGVGRVLYGDGCVVCIGYDFCVLCLWNGKVGCEYVEKRER